MLGEELHVTRPDRRPLGRDGGAQEEHGAADEHGGQEESGGGRPGPAGAPRLGRLGGLGPAQHHLSAAEGQGRGDWSGRTAIVSSTILPHPDCDRGCGILNILSIPVSYDTYCGIYVSLCLFSQYFGEGKNWLNSIICATLLWWPTFSRTGLQTVHPNAAG